MSVDRPTGGPAEDAPPPSSGAWAPVPAAWAPPQGDPIAPAQPPLAWFDPNRPQAHPPQPGPYWQQPSPYPGAQGFVGQPGGSGWQPPGGPPGHWTAAPPQPLAGFPPPVRPPQRGRGWLVALMTLAAVVVVSLIAALAVPLLTQLPSRPGGSMTAPSAPTSGAPTTKPTASPSPGSSPTSKPTSKPTASMPSDPLDVLKKNPVYALKVPAKCAYQSTPGSRAAFRKQVGKLVDCENAAWKKALAPTAVEFSKPKVKFYSSSTKSPCGKLGTNFPASYCTGDSTLYFSLQAYVQGRYFRLSVAHLVMHEYAHHVQNLAGIFDATDAMDEASGVTTRRIELQAHCISHYALTVSRVGFNSSDNQEIEYQWGYSNDPAGHGSTKAETYWGKRGLAAKTIGACNTWKAKASRVK